MRPRLLQNFRGLRALILATGGTGIDGLDTALERLGMVVAHVDLQAAPDLLQNCDVLFADVDLGPDLAAALCPLGQVPATPVIGLIGIEAPSRLKTLMELGATAMIRKPVHVASVYPALFLGINQFRARRDLQARLEEHERRRQGRRFLIKAIVQLMRTHGLSDDEAYDLLRRESMRARQTLEQYCEALLASQLPQPQASVAETPDQNCNHKGKGNHDASNVAA
jgi:AmiR/NasT family two-component response regulator